MSRIISSASKLVLLMVFFTVCAGFLAQIITAEQFLPVVMLVGGYYFGSANTRVDDVNTPDVTKIKPDLVVETYKPN